MMTDGPLSGGGIEWQSSSKRAAELVEQAAERVLDRAVIGPMRLRQPLFQLVRGRWAAARAAHGVACGRGRCPSPPRARGLSEAIGPDRIDGGIDLVLGAIAVDRGARRPRDDGADARRRSPPSTKSVDQRIFQRMRAPRAALAAVAISQSG